MQQFWKFYIVAACIFAVILAGCTDEELGVTPPQAPPPIATMPAIAMNTTTPAPEPTLFIPEYTNPPATTVEKTPVKPPLPSPVQEKESAPGLSVSLQKGLVRFCLRSIIPVPMEM